MELTKKEVIRYYKYVYLKMNLSASRKILLNTINNDFITKIFTDINFFNSPNFDGFDNLKLYNDLKFILKQYNKITRQLNNKIKAV